MWSDKFSRLKFFSGAVGHRSEFFQNFFRRAVPDPGYLGSGQKSGGLESGYVEALSALEIFTPIFRSKIRNFQNQKHFTGCKVIKNQRRNKFSKEKNCDFQW